MILIYKAERFSFTKLNANANDSHSTNENLPIWTFSLLPFVRSPFPYRFQPSRSYDYCRAVFDLGFPELSAGTRQAPARQATGYRPGGG